MKTAAYCRYSSDSQREASIRDQLRNIENYCARMGWPMPTLYKDEAISGARQDRPGYQAMLEAAQAGRIDVLLVDDLSRLSRDSLEPAREALRTAVGDIRIVPEGKALYAEMQKAGLSSSLKQIVMVAGAGFGNCLSSVRRVRLR